ncbi:MAG: hypothetical protein ACOCWR_10755, partial [Oceanidesulfovibrio sp.]
MDPHDMEELEESGQTDAASDEEGESQVPEEETPDGAPEPMEEIVLDAENTLLSLLSVTRTYALTRRNGGLLPKDMCKTVKDVVDEAFSLGLVAFATIEEHGGKHKGLALTQKGYDALVSGEA